MNQLPNVADACSLDDFDNASKIEGTVIVEFVINTEGRAEHVRAVGSPNLR